MRRTFSPCSLTTVLLIGGLTAPAGADSFPSTPSCPQTSSPTAWSGTALDLNTTKTGTLYNGPGADLELNKAGAVFNTKQMTTVSDMVYAAVGDFNKDGWPDFVGANEASATGYLDVFQNYTWQNENCTTALCNFLLGLLPNWLDPLLVVTPKFTNVRSLHTAGFSGRYALAATDFDGDGWDDVLEIQAPSSGYQLTTVNLYINKAANDSQNRPTFNAAYHPITGIASFVGLQTWSGTNIVAVDWNGDGYMDVLLGSGAQGGSIRIFKGSCTKLATAVKNAAGLWPCTSNPVFTDQGYLISNLDTNHTPATADGFGTNVNAGLPAFAYADIDGDGKRDLIVGGPNCCTNAAYRLRLFKGVSATAVETVASQSLTSTGAVTGVFVADFSQDGKPDLIVATDGHNYNSAVNGGTTYYYVNNGTNTPFSGGVKQQITFRGAPNTDYDVGFIFDYDRDPTHSPDLMVADGNDSAGYYVIADRQSTTYVDCGDAASGIIDLGSLLSTEMVVTAARITPTASLNSGTITYYLSNEEPPNWVQASLCASSTTDYCAAFPKAVGRSVRWKATMCSNSHAHVDPQAHQPVRQVRLHGRQGALPLGHRGQRRRRLRRRVQPARRSRPVLRDQRGADHGAVGRRREARRDGRRQPQHLHGDQHGPGDSLRLHDRQRRQRAAPGPAHHAQHAEHVGSDHLGARRAVRHRQLVDPADQARRGRDLDAVGADQAGAAELVLVRVGHRSQPRRHVRRGERQPRPAGAVRLQGRHGPRVLHVPGKPVGRPQRPRGVGLHPADGRGEHARRLQRHAEREPGRDRRAQPPLGRLVPGRLADAGRLSDLERHVQDRRGDRRGQRRQGVLGHRRHPDRRSVDRRGHRPDPDVERDARPRRSRPGLRQADRGARPHQQRRALPRRHRHRRRLHRHTEPQGPHGLGV